MSRQEFDLDSYAQLYIEAINNRQDAAELHIKFGNRELEAITFMRERLLQYLSGKYGATPETHDIAIDLKARKFITVEKSMRPEE